MKKEYVLSLLELRPFLFLNEDFIPMFKEIEKDLTPDEIKWIYFHVSALIDDIGSADTKGIIYHVVNEFNINLSNFIKVSKVTEWDISTTILYLTALDRLIPLYKHSLLTSYIDVPTKDTINKLKYCIDQLEEDGRLLNIDVSTKVEKLNTILNHIVDYFDIEMEGDLC